MTATCWKRSVLQRVQILSIILCQLYHVTVSQWCPVYPHVICRNVAVIDQWLDMWTRTGAIKRKLCSSEVRNILDIKANRALCWHSSLQHFIFPWICTYNTFPSVVRFLAYWCQYQKTFCLLHVYCTAFRVYVAFQMLILVVPVYENGTNCWTKLSLLEF